MRRELVRSSWKARIIALTVALSPWMCVAASAVDVTTPEACRAEPDNDKRRDCYDSLVDHKIWTSESQQARSKPQDKGSPEPQVSDSAVHQDKNVLRTDWNLAGDHEKNPPALQAYKLNYVLIGSWSDNPNYQPHSSRPDHLSTVQDLDSTEVKFQFSLKSQIGQGDPGRILDALGFDQYRVWLAYTQQSNWQAYNSRNSSPFRDNNYEPEFILTLNRPDSSAFKLLNIGIEHQSNGRSNPESRSWNRVYGQAGFEFSNFTLLARAWWRIPENAATDDNPKILEYIGRGEIVARWKMQDWTGRNDAVTLLVRDNFSLNPNRGFAQLDVSVPWLRSRQDPNRIRLHFQATTGYGQNLLDYNHRQTTVGIGVAFGDGTD